MQCIKETERNIGSPQCMEQQRKEGSNGLWMNFIVC